MLSHRVATPALVVLLVLGLHGDADGSLAFIGDPTDLEALPGHLLVLGEDGGVFVVRPDGTERRDLAVAKMTSGGGDDVVRAQPTWSPDGTRAAWTESARSPFS